MTKQTLTLIIDCTGWLPVHRFRRNDSGGISAFDQAADRAFPAGTKESSLGLKWCHAFCCLCILLLLLLLLLLLSLALWLQRQATDVLAMEDIAEMTESHLETLKLVMANQQRLEKSLDRIQVGTYPETESHNQVQCQSFHH
jgi:hypothetical protein